MDGIALSNFKFPVTYEAGSGPTYADNKAAFTGGHISGSFTCEGDKKGLIIPKKDNITCKVSSQDVAYTIAPVYSGQTLSLASSLTLSLKVSDCSTTKFTGDEANISAALSSTWTGLMQESLNKQLAEMLAKEKAVSFPASFNYQFKGMTIPVDFTPSAPLFD